MKAFLTGETYVFNYSILHPSSRAIIERDQHTLVLNTWFKFILISQGVIPPPTPVFKGPDETGSFAYFFWVFFVINIFAYKPVKLKQFCMDL